MIKVLPGHIANLIAAGEVVQRPSSVVKELIENAVDAGAQNIQVIIKDSGRTLIQIIDDGCGMSPEDAKTAFLRHATSKIATKEDLNSIHTFGFRGEALASICSVAEVTLRTKRAEDQTGSEIRYAESQLISQEPVATPNGSNFLVRNIFYNVPARRKFLKSDATEFRQITQEFTRIALTRPNLSFRLTHNNNQVFHLDPAPLKKRIQEVAGKEMIKELVELSVETSIVNISGYIGKPEDARKTAGNQYLFVNNRYFRSPYFQKAILKAYEGLIPDGYLPSFFIFFQTDPQKIDVNIHPSKTEVKFQDDYAIFDFLTSTVKESLGKNSFMPSIEFDMEGAPEIPKVQTGHYVPPPKIDYDPLFNPFKDENNRISSNNVIDIDRQFHNFPQDNFLNSNGQRIYNISEEPGVIFSESGSHNQKPILQIAGKYIATTIKSGIVLVDISRSRERILYERFLATLSTGHNLSQQTLFPQEVEVGSTTLSILSENLQTIRQMGFEMTIHENKIILNGLPEGFSELSDNLGPVIDNLTTELSEDGRDFAAKSKEQLAAQLARSGARGKREQLNNLEAQTLVDTLFACNEPNYTPAGNRCFTIIDAAEIENRFFN